ncbi:glycosyltransferase [bacterium]|nr:glycosyltransferase [bacterium]
MKISIAMAVYNGAQFIEQQLKSFTEQTLIPDELVITDDGSTDGTLDIVHTFAQHAPFKIRVELNEKNLGYARNFSRAVSLCSGDIIFLSDQDDEWLPRKIETVVGKLQDNPWAQVVVNDMIICDENLLPSKFTQLHNIISAGGRAEAFFSGCCMAIRKQFLELVLPLPKDLFAHDNWINHLSLSLGARLLLPASLQKYRRHNSNASNWQMSSTSGTSQIRLIRATGLSSSIQGWQDQIDRYKMTSERIASSKVLFESLGLDGRYDIALDYLDRRMECLDARIRLAARSRATRWVGVLVFFWGGGYSEFSGWKSALKDAIRP